MSKVVEKCCNCGAPAIIRGLCLWCARLFEVDGGLTDAEASMSEWQPIETAAKDGNAFLLFSCDEAMYFGYWHEHCGIWVDLDDGCKRTPTHWMPLPAPPVLPTPRAQEKEKA